MATYTYTARDANGATQNGTIEADTEALAQSRLREQGYFVQSLRRTKGKEGGAKKAAKPKAVTTKPKEKKSFSFGGGIKVAELTVFCRQFSTMIDAGVSLVRCLAVLQEQSPNQRFRRILADLQVEVESGNTLSRAMAKYPRIFNSLFIGLIKAGEVGGVLEESLQRLSSFLEKDLELRRKVKGAMTYPVIVMILSITAVLGLTTFILPSFFDTFTQLGLGRDTMPAMTVFMMDASAFLRNGFPLRHIIIGIVLFAAFTAWKAFTRTRFGRRFADRLKLKAPVLGSLNHKIALSRFARTLATLLVSGVPILQAMETVAGTVDNAIISDAIMDARASIREGDRIGDPLQRSKMFPPMVVQMISIGEESGALDAMLTKVAEFYEDEVDSAIESLTSAIEPLLIVFLGGSVGFIVIAVMMPMAAIIQGLSGGGTDSGGGE